MDKCTDRLIDGWTNGWAMFLFYTDAMGASNNDNFSTDFAIFTIALRIIGPTVRWADIPSYRDAIAAYYNM